MSVNSSKFKIGDEVRYISSEFCDMAFYPPIGTIGVVVVPDDEYNDIIVRWPAGTVEKNGIFPNIPYSWAANIIQVEKVGKNHKDNDEKEENMSNEEITRMLEPKFKKNEAKKMEDLIGTAYRCGYLRAKKGRPFKYEEKNGASNVSNVNKKKNDSKKGCNCEGNDKCKCESGCSSKEKFVLINNKKIWYDDNPSNKFEFGDKIIFVKENNSDAVWPKQWTMGIFLEDCDWSEGCLKGSFWVLWSDYAEVGKDVNCKEHCWYEYCRKVIRVEDV